MQAAVFQASVYISSECMYLSILFFMPFFSTEYGRPISLGAGPGLASIIAGPSIWRIYLIKLGTNNKIIMDVYVLDKILRKITCQKYQ